MKYISGKNYYIISLSIVVLIIGATILLVRIKSRSNADSRSITSPHLPETASTSPNSNISEPPDQIDIFAEKDEQ